MTTADVKIKALQLTNAKEKLIDLVWYSRKRYLGLFLRRGELRLYIRTLIWHLVQISKSFVHQHRNRAKTLLVSLVVAASAISWTGFRYMKGTYKRVSLYSRTRPPLLKRTRSQTRLAGGNRILYISENRVSEEDAENRGGANINSLRNERYEEMGRTKKIFIPKRDDDVFERDKYLFKAAESSSGSHSQLFYSKFLNQMSVLIEILLPSWLDQNVFLLVLQIFFLITRTWLSLVVARLDGQIVRDVIAGKGKGFLTDLACWFAIALPASYTNSAIKFLQRKISLNFRVYLTRYIHDMYLDERLAFYKLMFDTQSNGSVIKNIDNSITNDVTKFCDAICSVFANIAKPVTDLVFFAVYLRDNLGAFGVIGIFTNYFLTGYLLKRYTPPLGELASRKSSAEGDFYNFLLNMSSNNEEIAFYQGTEVEKAKVKELYNIYFNSTLRIDQSKFNYTMIEDYILKYTWSALGYVFASVPIVIATLSSEANSENSNMRDFIVNKRLMLSLADAGSRLMHSIKDISQLTGYTNRLFTLIGALHRVHFRRFNYGVHVGMAVGYGNSKDIVRGTIQRNFHGIRLENIDVVIPSKRASNGTKLLSKLTFQIPPVIEPSSKSSSTQDFKKNFDPNVPLIDNIGSSLLILGPNSCGKSSIQRIIAEVWPVYNKNGLLSIPAPSNLFCVPQKPYFTRGGTFRDQLIYPMSSDEFFDRGLKDKGLVKILQDVNLDYLLDRDIGWTYMDVVADWKDVLSGGEKQRMNFARILFHKPRFVILDEATNSISVDMEDYLFNLLKRCRFNFITISQRPNLIKYHDILVEIGSNCSWQLQTLGTVEAITSIEHEIEDLKSKLEGVENLERERKTLRENLEAF